MQEQSIPALWQSEWVLDEKVTYLNHGSFGPAPKVVQEAMSAWSVQLQRNPMDFFLRRMEDELENALHTLGKFVGASREGLIFCDNATTAMNVVAASITLNPGDEVLVNNHEYGAVVRLWKRTAQRTGAHVVTAELPTPGSADSEIVDAIFARVTNRTRLIVVSHVTSPTALILPVEKICRTARDRGIPVCVDGPHAVAMLPVNIKHIDCDFYTASCHKWLCGPIGTGFLYVHPTQRKHIQPSIVSWGGSVGGRQPSWKDEFNWIGTRNPAAFLAVKSAVEFMQQPGRLQSGKNACDELREHSKSLLQMAEEQITGVTNLPALIPTQSPACGTMACFHLPLTGTVCPPGKRDVLQDLLWEKYQIEVPIVHWNNFRFVRISAHLYNTAEHIHKLATALKSLL